MTLTLTPELEAMIREKVDSGRYATADEVIEAAVRLLDAQDDHLAMLRAKLQVGLDDLERGDTVLLTPELLDEIDREVEERFRRGDEPDPDVCP